MACLSVSHDWEPLNNPKLINKVYFSKARIPPDISRILFVLNGNQGGEMHRNITVNLIQHEVTPWRSEYLRLSAVCLCACVRVSVCEQRHLSYYPFPALLFVFLQSSRFNLRPHVHLNKTFFRLVHVIHFSYRLYSIPGWFLSPVGTGSTALAKHRIGAKACNALGSF